jgi:hypothetical protein
MKTDDFGFEKCYQWMQFPCLQTSRNVSELPNVGLLYSVQLNIHDHLKLSVIKHSTLFKILALPASVDLDLQQYHCDNFKPVVNISP